jgi:hypothetical protein
VSMPLAAIFGFCILLNSPTSGEYRLRELGFTAQEPQAEPASPQNAAPEAQQKTPEAAPQPSQEPEAKERKTGQTQPPAQTPGVAPKATPPQSQSKSTSTSAKKKRRKRRVTNTTHGSDSSKRVVRNGSTSEPVIQLSPGLSENEASSQRQNTTQLLATADTNLQKMSGRQLNTTQQDVVSQIRKYIEQAKEAETAGDLQRAHNLALKARLLSDDLVRQ